MKVTSEKTLEAFHCIEDCITTEIERRDFTSQEIMLLASMLADTYTSLITKWLHVEAGYHWPDRGTQDAPVVFDPESEAATTCEKKG